MYARNSNGTYRMTQQGTYKYPPVPDNTTIEPDLFTIGGVGGDHSNYQLIVDDISKYGNLYPKGTKLMLFSDTQQLNPQWYISSGIKNKLNLQKGTSLYNIVDKLGGVPLDRIVGYKPFNIEQYYVVYPNGAATPLFQDTGEIHNFLNTVSK